MAKEILTGSKASTVVKTLNGRAILDGASIHGLSASGKTITYTKGDSSTGTITTQDTTYTFAAGDSNGQIKVTPSSGTATNVSVKGLGSAAYTASTAYAAASHNQASSTINAMTGYSKASSASAIAATDSLNTAVGKLEKALDGKQASGNYAGSTSNGGPANTLVLANGTADAARYVVFQDSNNSTSALTACYDADFKYNPVSNVLTVGTLAVVANNTYDVGTTSNYYKNGYFYNVVGYTQVTTPALYNRSGQNGTIGTSALPFKDAYISNAHIGNCTLQYNATTESLDFVFA